MYKISQISWATLDLLPIVNTLEFSESFPSERDLQMLGVAATWFANITATNYPSSMCPFLRKKTIRMLLK